jgi:DNA polymerase
MPRLHVDIESFSRVDLRKCGVYRYAEDESTEVLCIAWALEGGDVQLWTPSDGKPELLARLMADPTVLLCAHNSNFERVMLCNHPGQSIGLPHTGPERWICTAAKASLHGLPRDLARAARYLGVAQKDEDGRRVMLKLSRPRKPSKNNPADRWLPNVVPHDYATLYEYCMQDVRVERAIDRALPDLQQSERDMHALDQRINDRGIPVDLESVATIRAAWKTYVAQLTAEARQLCGVSPFQVAQYLEQTNSEGLDLPDLTKATVAEALKGELTDKARRLLEIRAEAGKTSVKKFDAMANAATIDGRIKGMFLFLGASTGRWAGKIVQLHNLPRLTAKDPDGLLADVRERGTITGHEAQSLIRPMFTAPRYTDMLVGDFAGIEYRVATWITGHMKELRQVHAGADVYVLMAAKIFNKKPEDIDKDERFVGKQAILGLGFGMGWKKFGETCEKAGQPIPEELQKKATETYRNEYHGIKNAWKELENAAIRTVQTGTRTKALKGQVEFILKAPFLYARLPSGRVICWFRPEIRDRETPWGEMRPCVYYFGLNSFSNKWEMIESYGGKIFENIVQGLASDLLRHAMQSVESAGLPIILHIHDEIVSEGPEDRLDEFAEIMTISPPWFNAPIAVDAYATRRYRKG